MVTAWEPYCLSASGAEATTNAEIVTDLKARQKSVFYKANASIVTDLKARQKSVSTRQMHRDYILVCNPPN